MATTKRRKTGSANPPSVAVDERPPSLWSLHGLEDTYFQREAQVNFWGVMGGLQAAALLTQLGALWTQMQIGRWHLALYFVNSILVIVLGWALLAWGTLVLKEQLTIPNTLLMFVGNFAIAIQCLLLTNPAGWLAATALAALFQWMQQIYFSRSGGWESFSAETIKRLKANMWIYALWPLICIAGAVHLYLAKSAIAETAWGVIVSIFIIDALFRQHRGMESERKELGIP